MRHSALRGVLGLAVAAAGALAAPVGIACVPGTRGQVCAAAPYAPGSAAPPAGALAWATYDADALYTTGWAVLDVHAAPSSNISLASFAAGWVEGHLTWEQQRDYASNTGADAANSKKLQEFLDGNLAWMRAQVDAAPVADSYWAHVGGVLAQMEGVAAGQAAAGGALTLQVVYNAIIQGGDIFNLAPLYGVTAEQRARTSAVRGLASRGRLDANGASGGRTDHCSALVRLTPGARDIVVAHTTWSALENMLRIRKTYDLPLRVSPASAALVPGVWTGMSGYPLLQQYSSDDFYVLSSGLVTLETTIDNDNKTLAREFASEHVVLEWLRNIVANRLASTGPEWAELFSRHASGTYTNQWMVVDTNLFTPGTPPPPNTLTVLEELPGNIRVADKTPELRGEGALPWGAGVWASYSAWCYCCRFAPCPLPLPPRSGPPSPTPSPPPPPTPDVIADPELFELSGAQKLVDQYGGATSAGAYFTWLNTSRANIFRRDAGSVVDEATMRAMIRSNAFKTDPLSRLGCGSAPPYSATNAISDRSDLNEKRGDYVIPDLGHGDSAGIDAKLTLATWVRAAKLSEGELPWAAQSGPTITASCAPFSFSNATVKAPHKGLPDAYNFPWIHTVVA